MEDTTREKETSIGNPKSIHLKYVIKLIKKITNKKIKQNFLPLQTGDVIKTIANVKKEKSSLGYKFETNIEKGLEKFNAWFLENQKFRL